jgi:hypothetical protein
MNHKEAIYNEARDLFNEWYGEGAGRDAKAFSDQGACMYWAHCGMNILIRHGYRAVLQAGTMMWQVKEQSAAGDTHFGYEWSPHEKFSQEQLALGNLPEMHMWIALPDRNEIVDFSTGSLKKICEERHGLKWEMPDPPQFVWCQPEELRQYGLIAYWPNLHAIGFAWNFIIKKVMGEATQCMKGAA